MSCFVTTPSNTGFEQLLKPAERTVKLKAAHIFFAPNYPSKHLEGTALQHDVSSDRGEASALYKRAVQRYVAYGHIDLVRCANQLCIEHYANARVPPGEGPLPDKS